MTYPYDNNHYNPPAPVLPITMHIPGDSTKQVTTEALVDTGADITCLPRALINALGAEYASSYDVFAINGLSIGSKDSYFLEFEIATTKKIVEVIAVGDEPILGRNLINEFTLQFHGPTQELSITSE
jgi:predicted aspartyl protease